jgi:microcystin-dependent protein
MAVPFVAEIRIFSFNFAPTGWAFCDGQLIPLQQNIALFSLLGTTYGGDGDENFGLPDLQSRVPVHQGQGVGLTERPLGERGGISEEVILESQMPAHAHAISVAPNAGTTPVASPTVSLARSRGINLYQTDISTNIVPMAGQKLVPAGSGFPHNNLQPYLVLNFCIALQGVFPQRP